jgi:hypothetical protein
LKRFPDEVVDSQSGVVGINHFFAIGTGHDNLHVRPYSEGLFKDLPAGCPGERDIEQDHINFIFVCMYQV